MRKIAIVPGSYKPAHQGHYDMIRHYSEEADEVIVLISNPSKGSKSARVINGKEIDANTAKRLLELYTHSLENVKVLISEHPSPVKSTYDLIETLRDCDVLLGSSTKDGDDTRWSKIEAYMKEKNPSVTVDVRPVPVTTRDASALSASGMRNLLESNQDVRSFIPDHVDKERVLEVLKEMM